MLSEARLKVLIHQVESRIPNRITEFYQDPNNRRRVAVKYSADKAFLDSEGLKFTVIDPNNGSYRCDLLMLSIFKALWNTHRNTKKPKSYYLNILQKGKDLYKEIGCQDILDDKINISKDFHVDELH